MPRICALLLLGLLPGLFSLRVAGFASGRIDVSLPTLIAEIGDLDSLAEFPSPPFTTRLFSSFERLSETPTDSATWFANHDRGNCYYEATLREPTPYFRTSPARTAAATGTFSTGTRVGLARHIPAPNDWVWVYDATDPEKPDQRRAQGFVPRSALEMHAEGPVLAEMEGPGCLVRIWSANPAAGGRIRIYFDKEATPTIDAPLSELLAGRWLAETAERRFVPFPSPWAGERARGWNLDFPLPYAKHCKIVAEKPGLAYQIAYRTYPPTTAVRTFHFDTLLDMKPTLNQLATECLEACAPRVTHANAAATYAPQPARLPPGGQLTQELRAPSNGNGAIVAQQWLVEPAEPEILRGLVLCVTFDAAPESQVECPLGDFFAAVPGLFPFKSLPLAATEDGRLQGFWVMPFQNKVQVTLRNDSGRPATVTPVLRLVDRPWTPASMYFHARWRCDHEAATRPFQEFTRCHVTGTGRFVGLSLAVSNPVADWWGEGDEKIYVDDAPFPVWFGTGTDDYFGSGWADRSRFQTATLGRTAAPEADHRGWTSMYRFHLLDSIPFRSSVRIDQELHHWDPKARPTLSSVAYWYAQPESRQHLPHWTANDLRRGPLSPKE